MAGIVVSAAKAGPMAVVVALAAKAGPMAVVVLAAKAGPMAVVVVLAANAGPMAVVALAAKAGQWQSWWCWLRRRADGSRGVGCGGGVDGSRGGVGCEGGAVPAVVVVWLVVRARCLLPATRLVTAAGVP